MWSKLAAKFKDPLIIVLIVAMLLSLGVAAYDYYRGEEGLTVFLEPAGVLLAIILATGVSFYFELRSEREFELLNVVNDQVYYKVFRSGAITQVLRADIVVGDVIELETGEEIPADGTLLEATSLMVDESSLTGEPAAMKTTDEQYFDREATYPSNYLCRGTSVMDGHGVLQVEKVGDQTEFGKVYEGAHIDDGVETPLNRQLNRLSKLITNVSYLLAGLVLVGSVIAYAVDGGFQEVQWTHMAEYFLNKILIAVTVIVVAVPEGLPMAVSLSLAYSMRAMMKTNNLVRKMHACETMGAATVICTDKTGTLTQNRMTVEDVAFAPALEAEIALIAEAMAVNSTAHLSSEEGEDKALGNPTEGALLLWLREQGLDYRTLRESAPVVDQVPFSTERKYMATVVESQAMPGKQILYLKGAPEIVMGFCSIDESERSSYEQKLSEYQGRAMRTLGFAYQVIEGEVPALSGCESPLSGLTYMGVVGIEDPVRKEVPEAIQTCLDAGIDVKIITGDTLGTAREIGRQVGLWTEECTEDAIITGPEFGELSDEEIRPRLSHLKIMSRARPMDKERLVRLLQEEGEVVAVTGDGTNDAPALKRAQVGLSMGDGTSVAKEASDITILDNSFSSIVKAVIWGRSLYQNIQRFIIFQMTINVVACTIVLLGSFLGTESPLTVSQMLWVNLIMDTFAALALASLPPEPRVMNYPPRDPEEHIISPSMAKLIMGVGGIFVVLLFAILQYFKHYEVSSLTAFDLTDFLGSVFDFTSVHAGLSGYELTVFFCIFVLLQFWNMFNAKAFKTRKSAFANINHSGNFMLIAAVILLGQVVITTFGREMFRVEPLPSVDWLVIIASTSFVLWIGELIRLFLDKPKQKKPNNITIAK